MYKLPILCLKEYGSEGCRDLAIDLRNNKYTIPLTWQGLKHVVLLAK